MIKKINYFLSNSILDLLNNKEKTTVSPEDLFVSKDGKKLAMWVVYSNCLLYILPNDYFNEIGFVDSECEILTKGMFKETVTNFTNNFTIDGIPNDTYYSYLSNNSIPYTDDKTSFECRSFISDNMDDINVTNTLNVSNFGFSGYDETGEFDIIVIDNDNDSNTSNKNYITIPNENDDGYYTLSITTNSGYILNIKDNNNNSSSCRILEDSMIINKTIAKSNYDGIKFLATNLLREGDQTQVYMSLIKIL